MNMEDLALKIRLNPLVDFFKCPVCMCRLQQTFTTMCGHRFCENCIKECIDRHHRCPCCNKLLSPEDLHKDPLYDDLIDTINKERDKAEKDYFDKLIDAASVSESEKENNEGHFTAVELVLKKHLKQGLLAHQRYYQELLDSYQRRMDQTKAECQRVIEDLNSQGLMQEELSQQTGDLEQTYNRKTEALREELKSCEQLIANAFDRYLTDHIPDLSILPISISLCLLEKNITIMDVQLKPQDKVEDLKQIIEDYMELKGDKIVRFGDVRFIYFGPFSKRSPDEMLQVAADLVEFKATHPDVYLIPEGSLPLLQFSMKSSGVITVYGSIKCKSDLPKRCFVTSFEPGVPLTVDYFSCKDCSFNWVCRSCMEVCHKDHTVVPYIMNHQPTWACCYCPKKKTCILQG